MKRAPASLRVRNRDRRCRPDGSGRSARIPSSRRPTDRISRSPRMCIPSTTGD